MRKFLTTAGLLLCGYLIGFRKGAKKVGVELLDAHFEAFPDVPLVVKGENVEMTVMKLQPETKEEESE